MEDDGEKQNRILLRPWLEKMLEANSILGLEWCDEKKTMFRVPWKHRSKKDWSLNDSRVFLEWARNTGRLKEEEEEAGNPDFAQLKTRFRCALNKAPDIEEVSALRCDRGEEPYKVYRFTKHKESSMKKVTVAMSLRRKLRSNQDEGSNSSKKISAESFFSDVSLGYDEQLDAKQGTGLQMVNSDCGYMDKVDRNSRFRAENEREASKTFIPLSVELLTNTWSDCSGSDHSSPTMSDQPADIYDRNTASFTDSIHSSGNIESKTLQSSPNCTTFLLNSRRFGESAFNLELQGLPANEHMLQVASLFVEAEAKRTQQEVKTTEHYSRLVIDETYASEYQNLIVVKPADDDQDAAAAESSAELFAADPSAQMIHRSSKECHGFAGCEFKPVPFDLTKKNSNKERWTNVHWPKSAFSSLFEQVVEGDSKETLMNFIGEISDEELNFQESDSVQEIRRKVQQNEQLLVSKAKMLYMWEERLKKWEAKLQAMEDACFWKNKYLDAKLAGSGVDVPESRQHSRMGPFPQGNSGQSVSRLTLPVEDIQRDGARMHTAATSGTVQNFSQGVARSELDQRMELLRNLNAQTNRNVEQFAHSHSETSLKLGKVEKRKQLTVISGDSVISKEPSLKKWKMEYRQPTDDTESSCCRPLFAAPPILGQFASARTMHVARFQIPVKGEPSQGQQSRYECKSIPSSIVSEADHPTADVALGSEFEKAILMNNFVDLRNFSVPIKCSQENGREEIFSPSISSLSIPSIAYVLPCIAEQPDDVSLNKSADPNFPPVTSNSSCCTPYTVAIEVISDCESELISESSKIEDMEASLIEEKCQQASLVENSSSLVTVSPTVTADFSVKQLKKHSFFQKF